MNFWIITTGSSDVQLMTKDNWSQLHKKVRSQLETQKQFTPAESEQSDQKRWLVPSRVMGRVYSPALKEHYSDLDFPLLNSFLNYLKNPETKVDLSRIIVLLTDQSEGVKSAEKNKPSHPFWQDTCTLQPILEKYLQEQFPDVKVDPERDFLILKPEKNEQTESNQIGLDDWNDVLKQVQAKFKNLEIPEEATVYVSHQAGTPAISSAVQFESLAQFGRRVKFLVSNEYSQETRSISRSNYLLSLQLQEAKALLKRHDYAGVKLLVSDSVNSDTNILLDAAIKWNVAKFDEFRDEIQKISNSTLVDLVNDKAENWWWTAYESAYLAAIRHRQQNIVEALFHSFRSVEGSVCQWAEEKYKDYIFYDKKGSPQINETIREIFPEYWAKIEKKHEAWLENLKEQNENRKKKGKDPNPVGVGLFSQTLYSLLEAVKPNCKKDPDLKKGLYSAKDERNQQFHRLLGLREEDLFTAWQADDAESWKSILLGCLNFIAQDDLPEGKPFSSLEEASVMARLHGELEKAIAQY